MESLYILPEAVLDPFYQVWLYLSHWDNRPSAMSGNILDIEESDVLQRKRMRSSSTWRAHRAKVARRLLAMLSFYVPLHD